MKTPVIVILSENSFNIARQIQQIYPEAVIYGLETRIKSRVITYDNFGELIRNLFQQQTPIIGICAAGILIRTIAPLLNNKWEEPPVLAIAEDGSAVVPLLGGIKGVNDFARKIATALKVAPAITTTGEIRFKAALLNPPLGYKLVNPEIAKTFISDILSGEEVKIIGEAPWLSQGHLPISDHGKLTIQIINNKEEIMDEANTLVYKVETDTKPKNGTLTIVGIGPGAIEWITPEVRQELQFASDWVGYKTYLDLIESIKPPHIIRHESDNRVELDRAEMALNLAATGRTVVLISSGDPTIYAMASTVFEVIEKRAKVEWEAIEIKVCPGISAMQAASAQVGAFLGHDFCVISLSNILKSWDVITQRIRAAAEADFVIAFYNPVSSERRWQLEQAKEILLEWRSPETIVVLARNLGRQGQTVRIKKLADLVTDDADMLTVILVGSTQTRLIRDWVYTPRFYE